jgi:hypothetical protein
MKFIYHNDFPFNEMHQEVLNGSQWPLLKTPFHDLHQKVKVGLKGWLRAYGLVRGYHFGMKRSTRIKDDHLKGCMVGQKCKPKISERSSHSVSYQKEFLKKSGSGCRK